MTKVNYDRTDVRATVEAAHRVIGSIETSKVKFVYATANGFVVSGVKPPIAQDYYRVTFDQHELITANPQEYYAFGFVIATANNGAKDTCTYMGNEDTLDKAIERVTGAVIRYMREGVIVYRAEVNRMCKRCNFTGTIGKIGHAQTCPSCRGAPLMKVERVLIDLPFTAGKVWNVKD